MSSGIKESSSTSYSAPAGINGQSSSSATASMNHATSGRVVPPSTMIPNLELTSGGNTTSAAPATHSTTGNNWDAYVSLAQQFLPNLFATAATPVGLMNTMQSYYDPQQHHHQQQQQQQILSNNINNTTTTTTNNNNNTNNNSASINIPPPFYNNPDTNAVANRSNSLQSFVPTGHQQQEQKLASFLATNNSVFPSSAPIHSNFFQQWKQQQQQFTTLPSFNNNSSDSTAAATTNNFNSSLAATWPLFGAFLPPTSSSGQQQQQPEQALPNSSCTLPQQSIAETQHVDNHVNDYRKRTNHELVSSSNNGDDAKDSTTANTLANKKKKTSATTTCPVSPTNSAAFTNTTSTASSGTNSHKNRRCERNIREQHRSQRISQQIKDLQSLLQKSQINYKPTKFSVLKGVGDYIEKLQRDIRQIEDETQKLRTVIAHATRLSNTNNNNTDYTRMAGNDVVIVQPSNTISNRIVNPSSTSSSSGSIHHPDASSSCNNEQQEQQDLYKAIFYGCHIAMGIASLDGTFVDCNLEFERLSKCTKAEVVTQSLFHFIRNSDMADLFKAMGQMLRTGSSMTNPTATNDEEDEHALFWSGPAFLHRNSVMSETSSSEQQPQQQLLLSITLTKSIHGSPKFFNCVLSSSLPGTGSSTTTIV